jgi:chorismate mutase / prephenate dehydratase
MPDTTPNVTQTDDAPPSDDVWRPDLLALRARLDELDDKIHDLLMQRALVIESVARSGKPAAFRPGREAAILRRLLARHSGKLPARTLVRMWREMLAGTTAMQANVTIAVMGAPAMAGMDAMAREQFGFLTPVIAYPSAKDALRSVRSGATTLAVLPFPTEADAWWFELNDAEPRLYIAARLPFWTERPSHVPDLDALVVCTAAPDLSGGDRSFIAAPDRACLADAGFAILSDIGTVFEVAGMVEEGDVRLPAGSVALGGYAVGEPT